MNSHWTRQQVNDYLRGGSVRAILKSLMLLWLPMRLHQASQDHVGLTGITPGPFLGIERSGVAGGGAIRCTEILAPDNGDLVTVYLSPGLDTASDLGASLAWVQRESGCLQLTGAQRASLHQPTGPLGRQSYHSKHITQAIPGNTARERIENAPAVIAEVWLRAYERMWVRYDPAWTDPTAAGMAVELAAAAEAMRREAAGPQ